MNVIVQSCFDVVQWSDNERKRLNEKVTKLYDQVDPTVGLRTLYIYIYIFTKVRRTNSNAAGCCRFYAVSGETTIV